MTRIATSPQDASRQQPAQISPLFTSSHDQNTNKSTRRKTSWPEYQSPQDVMTTSHNNTTVQDKLTEQQIVSHAWSSPPITGFHSSLSSFISSGSLLSSYIFHKYICSWLIANIVWLLQNKWMCRRQAKNTSSPVGWVGLTGKVSCGTRSATIEGTHLESESNTRKTDIH
jgi:hypothetical protein